MQLGQLSKRHFRVFQLIADNNRQLTVIIFFSIVTLLFIALLTNKGKRGVTCFFEPQKSSAGF